MRKVTATVQFVRGKELIWRSTFGHSLPRERVGVANDAEHWCRTYASSVPHVPVQHTLAQYRMGRRERVGQYGTSHMESVGRTLGQYWRA
eukprot:1620463-Rhodomonas_salina.2